MPELGLLAAPPVDPALGDIPAAPPPVAAGPEEAEDEELARAVVRAIEAEPDAAAQMPQMPEQPAETEYEEQRRERTKHRNDGMTWLNTNPLTKVIVMRMTIQATFLMMIGHLKISNAEFDRQQLRKAAAAKKRGEDPVKARACRVHLLYTGKYSWASIHYIAEVMRSHDAWDILPASDVSRKTSSLAFRLLTRTAAAVYQLVIVIFRSWPYKIFYVLVDPRIAYEAANITCRCTMDRFTYWLMARRGWSAERLLEEESKAKIAAWAPTLKTDSVVNEAGHASFRRQVFHRNVQCQAPSFELIAAEFSSRNHTIRELDLSDLLKLGDPNESVGDGAENLGKQSRPRKPRQLYTAKGKVRKRNKYGRWGGGGGSWRFFCRLKARGGRRLSKQDWTRLSHQYKNLSAEEMANLKAAGRSQTLAHRHGAVIRLPGAPVQGGQP